MGLATKEPRFGSMWIISSLTKSISCLDLCENLCCRFESNIYHIRAYMPKKLLCRNSIMLNTWWLLHCIRIASSNTTHSTDANLDLRLPCRHNLDFPSPLLIHIDLDLCFCVASPCISSTAAYLSQFTTQTEALT